MRSAEILLATAQWIEDHIEQECLNAVPRQANGQIDMVTQASVEQRNEAKKVFGRAELRRRIEDLRWEARQLDKADGLLADQIEEEPPFIHVERPAPKPSGNVEPTAPSAPPPWTGTCPVLGCAIEKLHAHRVSEAIVYPGDAL